MTTTTTLLDAAAALVLLDMAGAISAVHIADAPDALADADADALAIDTVAAGYWPRHRLNVGTDPRATATLAAPRTAAASVRDPFRAWHA